MPGNVGERLLQIGTAPAPRRSPADRAGPESLLHADPAAYRKPSTYHCAAEASPSSSSNGGCSRCEIVRISAAHPLANWAASSSLRLAASLLPLGHFQRDAHAAKVLARTVVQFARDLPPLVVLGANQAGGELAQLFTALLQLGGSLGPAFQVLWTPAPEPLCAPLRPSAAPARPFCVP